MLEINVLTLFYLNVYFIFLKVSQEFDLTGTFVAFLGDTFLDYFLGFYFEDENSLVRENPLFYFVSSYFFWENAFVDAA